MIHKQFLLFLLAGGIAAAANFGSRILLSHVMHYVPAIIVASLVGMCTAFLLNRAFVFTNSANSAQHQVFWFVVVNLLAVAQTVLISLFFARILLPAAGIDSHVDTIAHGIGVAVPVVTSYIGHKRLSFR
jgi:putative flippase GtrA